MGKWYYWAIGGAIIGLIYGPKFDRLPSIIGAIVFALIIRQLTKFLKLFLS